MSMPYTLLNNKNHCTPLLEYSHNILVESTNFDKMPPCAFGQNLNQLIFEVIE